MLLATSISCALAIGLLHSFVESVRPALEERHGLDEKHGRRLTRLYTLLSAPLLLLAGWLCDLPALASVLFFGSLALGVGVAFLTQSRTMLPWAIFTIAAGGAGVTTAGLVLMATAIFPNQTNNAAGALTLGFAFIGVGALLTPYVVPPLIRYLGFRQTLVFLALLCIVPAGLSIFCQHQIEFTKEPLLFEGVLHDPRLWLLAIPTLLYFPLDRSLDVWTQPYLAELGYRGRAIVRLLIGFWLAFLLMRVAFAWIVTPGYEVWALLTLLVVSSMVLGNLSGAFARSSGYVGFWLVGACYGPLLPGFLGTLIDFDSSHNFRIPTVVLGGLFSLGCLSDLILEPGLVAFAKRRSARAAMRIPMILALVMAAPILILALIRFYR
ncbi:MAG: hypothetical protein HY040_20700 [Planctomycetes bacterium]|nr:hypothetical protein [Planctomycetota bacterium]